jgi:hypothetical protein
LDVTLIAPAGLLLLIGGLPALTAFALGERRSARARAILRLHPAGRLWRTAAAVSIAAVAVLLALAAARPVVRESHGRYLRTDAEAIFALDISRSMLAAESATAPNRLARAKKAATALRAAIPDVPAGVASFTDRILPNLFPTVDATAFAATVDRSIGIEHPPPGGSGLTITTFDALPSIVRDGYFTPGRKRRVLVILSDAESRDFDVAQLRSTLRTPGLSIVLYRLGSTSERVFGREGLPEADYRPEATTQTVKELVDATGARAFGEGQLGAAGAAIRQDLGRGPRMRVGTQSSSTEVAPYLVLAAFAPLGLLLWRRNVL